MSKLFRRIAPALVVALGLALPAFGQTPLTIIHVNDTHSHVDSFGPRGEDLEGTIGGLERAAGLIGTAKATEPNAVFVHAGDAFHGDLMFNALFDVPELAILKQLGLDAMAVGNHEFDLKPLALYGALAQVGGLPMTSANLDFSACPVPPTAESPCAALPQWIRPGFVREVGNDSVGTLRVGFFGLTPWDDPTMQPPPVAVLPNLQTPTPAAAIAQAQVAALRAQGAQVVVLLSHLGRLKDRDLVSHVSGIDVVIGGHDHRVDTAPEMLVALDGRKVPVVSAGDNYLYVGRLRLIFTPEQGVSVVDWTLLPVDRGVPPVPAIAAQVDSFKSLVAAKCAAGVGDPYHTAVGYAAFEIPKSYDATKQKRDTAMGNLITDSFRRYTGTDIALTVTGLVSEKLYPGPLVAADIYRPVSYGYGANCLGFQMATFEIAGAQLLNALEITAASMTTTDTLDVQASGLRYKLDTSKDPGHRVLVDSVHVNGEKLELGRTYTATTNAGIAGLIPTFGVTISNVKLLPVYEYTLLHDYVQALGTVDYTSEARIRDVSAQE